MLHPNAFDHNWGWSYIMNLWECQDCWMLTHNTSEVKLPCCWIFKISIPGEFEDD